MATTMMIPVTVASEAASRVAELGMQRQFEQMLEHTRQSVPELRSIEVTLAPPYELGDAPRLIIEATMDKPRPLDDPTEDDWGEWAIATFIPGVDRHFTMLTVYGASLLP